MSEPQQLLHRDADLLGHHRRLHRHMVLVTDQQLQRVGARRQGQLGFRLALAEMQNLLACRQGRTSSGRLATSTSR